MLNLDRIREMLKENGLEAVMLTSEVNRLFATGFHSTAGVAIITQQKGYFFTDFRYIEAAKAQAVGFNVEMTTGERPYKLLINEVIAGHNIKQLGFEEEAMSVYEHTQHSENIPAGLVPAQGLLFKLRAVKQPFELERMRRAQSIADLALEQTLPLIRPGLSERELAAELVYRLLKNGAGNVSFDPIVVSGPNSSMPHGVPGDRKIENGDFVTMDFGCLYQGYCSDMTRTIAVGSATDEMKKIYDIVLRAQLAGIAVARAGIVGSEIDKAGRSLIESEGYGDFFGHGFGHGIGLEIHERPNASHLEKGILPLDAVVSAEPGIYLPGRFGVRIEDCLILKEGGSENLTHAPKGLMIV